MEMKNMMISFLAFALFTIALINFAVEIGTENNANHILTENNTPMSSIYEGVNETIYDYEDRGLQTEANASFESFNEDDETTGVLGTITDFFISSLLAVGKSIMGIANTIFEVTFSPILNALGLPEEVASVVGVIVSTIMLFTVILLAWSLYRTGR